MNREFYNHVVVIAPGVAAYAKLESYAFQALKVRGLFERFNRAITGVRDPVKVGNKFLKKHGLKPIELLSDEDITRIVAGGDAPLGSLLTRVDDQAQPI